MSLSIIIINYKTSDLLRRCLWSIKEAAVNLISEIIVVDSEATTETGEMMEQEFPGIKYMPFKKNVGYARAVNRGLKEASKDFLLVLNADIITEKDSLEKMMDYLKINPIIGVLGPQLLNFDGSIQESCYRFYKPLTIIYRRSFLGKTKKGQAELARFLMRDFNRQSICDVEWLMGAALMISRPALEKVGLMDERFFLYFEDIDWCRRFWENGYKVAYFPMARMHHYHGRGSKKTGGVSDIFFNKYTWIHISSAIKYFWKWQGR